MGIAKGQRRRVTGEHAKDKLPGHVKTLRLEGYKDIKLRRCLGFCNEYFWSSGKGNRVCVSCKRRAVYDNGATLVESDCGRRIERK